MSEVEISTMGSGQNLKWWLRNITYSFVSICYAIVFGVGHAITIFRVLGAGSIEGDVALVLSFYTVAFLQIVSSIMKFLSGIMIYFSKMWFLVGGIGWGMSFSVVIVRLTAPDRYSVYEVAIEVVNIVMCVLSFVLYRRESNNGQ